MKLPKCSCVLIVVAIVVWPVSAQTIYSQSPNWTSDDDDYTIDVAIGDIDGDGDQDVIAGNYHYPYNFSPNNPEALQLEEIGGTIVGYENIDGDLQPSVLFDVFDLNMNCLALADCDKDGDLDLAVGHLVGEGNDGGVIVYRNQRVSREGEAWSISEIPFDQHYNASNTAYSTLTDPEEKPYDCTCLGWVDFDCDGDLDLIAMEFPGNLHLYQSSGIGITYELNYYGEVSLNENLSENLMTQGGTRVVVSPSISGGVYYNNQGGGSRDEFLCYSVLPELSGTTLEIADIDLDGDPDLFTNCKPRYTTSNNTTADAIAFFKNDGGPDYYSIDSAIPHVVPLDDDGNPAGREGAFCSDIAWWNDAGEMKLALIVGGASNQVQGDDPNLQKGAAEGLGIDPSGVNIYIYDEMAKSLKDRWDSEFVEGYEEQNQSRQFYSDIVGVELDTTFDSGIDIIASSYPYVRKEGARTFWVRGREHMFRNTRSSVDSVMAWYTLVPDLSTCLAVGIINPENEPTLFTETFALNQSHHGRMVHVRFKPIRAIESVFYRTATSDWIPLGSDDYCTVLTEGWISVNPTCIPDAVELQISYYYSQALDLVVGNDGPNLVYYYGNGVSIHPPEATCILNEVLTDCTYSDTIPNTENVDLMDRKAPLGVTFPQCGVSAGYMDQFLDDYPNIGIVGVHVNWIMEVFRGRYFWDRSDKMIDRAIKKNRKVFTASFTNPSWVMGNYRGEDADDPFLRTSDERLHTHFVRQIVNRYRPDGILDTKMGWGSGDGVCLFQFVNEPANTSDGYGWNRTLNDPRLEPIAEKLYRNYQLINKIQDNLPGSSPDLMVISPNFGNEIVEGEPYHYLGPSTPYLNALNDVSMTIGGMTVEHVLDNYVDYICQQVYCCSTGGGSWFNTVDPFLWETVNQNNQLRLGVEHLYAGYYTDYLDDYYNEDDLDWSAPLDENREHPFFVMEFNFALGNDEYHWAGSEIAELFSIDVFPLDGEIDHRLLQYCVPGWDGWSMDSVSSQMVNTLCGQLNGEYFLELDYENIPPENDDVIRHSYVYDNGYPPDRQPMAHVFRTLSSPREEPVDFTLLNQYIEPGELLPIIKMDGSFVAREVTEVGGIRVITLNENELQPDELIMLVEHETQSPGGDSSQRIQLVPGWNLVGTRFYPVGGGEEMTLNQVLGSVTWFNPSRGDRVGWCHSPPGSLYPTIPGYADSCWDMRQAYNIYLDSDNSKAVLWEIQNQPLYTPEAFDFYPSSEWSGWSNYLQLPDTSNGYWFFMNYPLQMQLAVESSTTIEEMVANTANPLLIIKTDDGRIYDPNNLSGSNLEYLEPGQGYFLGFANDNIVHCDGFVEEAQSVPESDRQPKKAKPPIHFQFKSRTHWWYPVIIDSIGIDGINPQPGDEIAVFDGGLCVGATVFDGQYPIVIAAWQDDIASPAEVDGYNYRNEIRIVWHDRSSNREITFQQPERIDQPDPLRPTASGFGVGLCTHRSLTEGIESTVQLPRDYELEQNYPNPFNAWTTIPVSLPQRSHIKLEVFNIAGQKICTIHEGIVNAGQEQYYFNGSNLPSAVYIYRLTAEGKEWGGDHQSAMMMTLIK